MSDKRHVATQYFQHVRHGASEEIAAMFSADGCLRLPDGRVAAGPASIERLYREISASSAPAPSVRAVFQDGSTLIAELDVAAPDGRVNTVVDVFRLAESGTIDELCVYLGAVRSGDAIEHH